MFDPKSPVSCRECGCYEPGTVKEALLASLHDIGVGSELFAGKKVVIKPNLVHKCSPDDAATTDPSLIFALCSYILECGGSVTVAESPGGVYSEATLSSIYRATGIEKAVNDAGAVLNYDTSFGTLDTDGAASTKYFEIISPILSADIIINACKLKTHGLTIMSGAVKNLFGTIPGIKKFEMHARFSDASDFENMLLDLCLSLHKKATVISVCDAVTGMEGNGPTAGSPRKIGCILASRNPCNLDLIGTHLIGLDGKVEMLELESARNWCPGSYTEVPLAGDDISRFVKPDFVAPDTAKSKIRALLTFGGGRFSGLLSPKPQIIDKSCIGCGICVRSCPRHTISIQQKHGHRVARIDTGNCIHCFCCQELCPNRAVKIKTNPIISVINAIK